MIFGVSNPEETWHHQLVHLPTSPVYCGHCIFGFLGNPKSYFSPVLFIHNSDNLRYLRIEQTVTLLSTTSEKCYHTSLQNAKLFHLTKGNVAFLKAFALNNIIYVWILLLKNDFLDFARYSDYSIQARWANVQANDVKFPQDLAHQKSLKSVNFWQSYLKNKKVDVLGTRCYIRQRVSHRDAKDVLFQSTKAVTGRSLKSKKHAHI